MITSEKFAEAIEFAIDKHRGQTRKGDGSPYIVHPMRVMHRVNEIKKGTKNLFLLGAAAILHDTVEDCDVTLEEIAEKFGHHVAAIVQELTLDKSQYEKQGKATYLKTNMLGMSSYALTIKLCDRLDNVSDLVTMDQEFRERYLIETIEILEFLEEYRALTKTQKKLVKLIHEEISNY